MTKQHDDDDVPTVTANEVVGKQIVQDGVGNPEAGLAAGPVETRDYHDPTQAIFDREQARADARRAGDELVDEDSETTVSPEHVSAPQDASKSPGPPKASDPNKG